MQTTRRDARAIQFNTASDELTARRPVLRPHGDWQAKDIQGRGL